MPILKPTHNRLTSEPKFPESIKDLFPAEYDFSLIGKEYYFKDYERKSHYYESLCRAANHSNPYLCHCEFSKIMRLSQMGLEVFSLNNEERRAINFGT